MPPFIQESKNERIPITINIPPPPGYNISRNIISEKDSPPAYLAGRIIIPEQQEFTFDNNSDHANNTFEPTVGDIKLTLDDLKTSILSYYAKLYALEGQTIDERLHYLQQYHYPSVYPINPILHVKQKESMTHLSESGQQTKALKPYKNYEYTSQHQNLKGVLDRSENRDQGTAKIHPASLMTKTKPFNEIFFDTAPGSVKLSTGIEEVLGDIKHDVDAVTRRLAGTSGEVLRETENPTLKAFCYNNVPGYKRRPYFGSQQELEEHMVQLYSDLYNKTQFNEKKIRALRHRMTALQMASLAPMIRLKDDPRIAY